MTKRGGNEEHRQPLQNVKFSTRRGMNTLLAAIYRDTSVSGLDEEFFCKVCSMQLDFFSKKLRL